MGLSKILGEALDDVVAVSPAQSLHFRYHSFKALLCQQQAGIEAFFLLLAEPLLIFSNLFSAVKQLELLVALSESLANGCINGKSGRSHDKKGEPWMEEELLYGASSLPMRKSRRLAGFSCTTCCSNCSRRP